MPSSLIKGFSDFRPQLRPLQQAKAGALNSTVAVKKVEALPSAPAAQTSAPWYKDPKAQKTIAAVGSLIASYAAYRYFSTTNQQDPPPPPPGSNQCMSDLTDPDFQAHLSQVSQATGEPTSKVYAEIYLAGLARVKMDEDFFPTECTFETFAQEESLKPKLSPQPNPPPVSNGANGAGNQGGKPKAAPKVDTQRMREELAKSRATLNQLRQRNDRYRTSATGTK